jgi:hypothetical protein
MKITTVRESLLAGGCAAAVAVVSLSAGCQQEPIDPQALADHAADNVAAVFQSAAHSAQGNDGVGKAASRIGSGLSTVARSAGNVPLDPTHGSDGPGALPRLISPRSALGGTLRSVPGFRAVARPFASESMFGPSPVGGALYATEAPSELASDLDEAGGNLRRLLKERIFTAANLESKTDSEAIYLLRPDSTCRDLEDNSLDKKCVDNLTKVDLRVRLTRAGGGVRFEVLVGSERARPVALSISDVQVALDLYLGGLKTTSAILARNLGSDDDTPDVLEGALRWALTKESDHRASIALSITEAVTVEKRGDGAMKFKSATANPLLALTADGDAGTITGRTGLGKTEVFAPWQPDGNKNTGADMHLVLGGLTGAITFTEASDTVKLTGLGLGDGPTFLEVRGQRIMQVDLNENDGRAYDVSIDFDASGKPRLALSPRFDLSLAWKLAAVMGDFKKTPPAHMLDERYQLKLDPAGGMGPVFGPYENPTTHEGGLRLHAGKLTLSSSKVAMPFTLEAGQCLAGAEPAADQHPVLGAFKAGPCP